MSLNRILKKVNQAKHAVKSVKGIQAKWKSIGYDTIADIPELKSQHAAATKLIKSRRANFAQNQSARIHAKAMPPGYTEDLIYPWNDQLENYIVFRTFPRIVRAKASVTQKGLAGLGIIDQGDIDEDQASRMNLLSKDNISIKLYVPDELNSVSAVQYQAENVGAMWRGGDVNSGALLSSEGKDVGSFIKGLVSGMSSGVQKMMNAATGNNLFLMQGKAVNPMQEQMLKGVDFRPWSFNYVFFPKSAQEADQVNKIIYSFRTAMLPDTYPAWGASTANSENFFNYPNIFEVNFEGPIANKVDGFLPMVCTQCNVNHAGGLKFSTYADGQPIKTTMQLSFMELKILTQESYQEISPLGDKSITSMDSIVIKQAEFRQGELEQAEKDRIIEMDISNAKAEKINQWIDGNRTT